MQGTQDVHMKARKMALTFYKKEMLEVVKFGRFYIMEKNLKKHHEKYLSKAMDVFRKVMIDDEEFSFVVERNMESELTFAFEFFKPLNKSESPYWKEGEIPDVSGPTQYKQALVVSENLKAMEKAENFYKKEMNELCHADKPSLTDEDLKDHHEKNFSKAVAMFREAMVKEEEFSSVCDKKLESKLRAQFEYFRSLNESKRKSEFVLKVTFVTTLALAGIGIYSMWRRRS